MRHLWRSAALAAAILSANAHANPQAFQPQQSGQGEGQAGQQMVTPWKDVNLPADRRKVYQFFMFSCGYCMQSDAMFVQWARTLPRAFSFEQIPVITNDIDLSAAMAFYAVAMVAPHRVEAFKDQMYRLMTLSGGRGISKKEIFDAAMTAGVNGDRLYQALMSKQVSAATKRAVDLREAYSVEHTPTLGIAGRYVSHAGFTGGNYDMLLQLGNGLVSREMGAMK